MLSEKAQEANAKFTYLTPVNREAKLDAATAAKLPSGEATLKIMRWSQGIPRLINAICDRALLGAFGQDRRRGAHGEGSRRTGKSGDYIPGAGAPGAKRSPRPSGAPPPPCNGRARGGYAYA